MNLKNKLKSKIKTGSKMERIIRFFYTLMKRPEYMQRKASYGNENQEKIIYIIRPNTNDCIQGLMSLFIQVMRKIDYANKMNYIPYVDFKNYKTQYSSDGIENSWEWFFTQPTNIRYESVYNSKKVVLSGVSLKENENMSLFKDSIFKNDDICKNCHSLIWNNISLNDRIVSKVREEEKNIDIAKCIGVYIRGTDYTELKPSGEYVQPSINEVIKKIDEYVKKYPLYNIFLVTEDKKNYDALYRKYGEKIVLVSFDSFIEDYDGKNYLSKTNLLNNDKRKRGEDYLVKIVLLSKCGVLISSITCGSIAAYAMNGNKYKEKYIFNLMK